MSTTRVQLRLPNNPEETPDQVFTAEAVAGMVGQTPRWAANLDMAAGGGLPTTIVDAVLEDRNIIVTVEVDSRAAIPAGLEEPLLGGIGYMVDKRDDDHDTVAAAALRMIGPLTPR